MASPIGLISLALPLPLLMVTAMIVGQLVEWLMKRATVSLRTGKLVMLVPLPLAALAKPLVKVTMGLVEGLFPASCLDKELLENLFCSH